MQRGRGPSPTPSFCLSPCPTLLPPFCVFLQYKGSIECPNTVGTLTFLAWAFCGSATFQKQGDGGYINWAFSGYDTYDSKKGYVTFPDRCPQLTQPVNPPPTTPAPAPTTTPAPVPAPPAGGSGGSYTVKVCAVAGASQPQSAAQQPGSGGPPLMQGA